MNAYHVGDKPRLRGTLEDASGVDTDPGDMTIKVKSPSGTITTYDYPGDVTKVATGIYQIDVSATESGKWFYRFASTGTGQAAMENGFLVIDSQF